MHERVHIGAAAALYGLTPATLRWWEEQAVLPHPARAGDRRLYDHRDLRRIGMAYLCCVAGNMPLSRAATVTTGAVGHQTWQAAVNEEILRLGREIARLETARDQLRHLLHCTDDDPAADCPYLDDILVRHTPRGRVGEADLVAAARAALRTRPAGGRRDETAARTEPSGDETEDGSLARRCATCAGVLQPARGGRPRIYCSPACRQRAYRRRAAAPAAEGGRGGDRGEVRLPSCCLSAVPRGRPGARPPS
jgi:MerR family copper efflux transcriptional regulator